MVSQALSIIPSDTILFIGGTPGSGKTTVSYELLKRYDAFRIIEETDIIRDVIRGYNSFLSEHCNKELLEKLNLYSSNIIMSYQEALGQCKIMKKSLFNVAYRQQRKGIPSIINGVHIIPEELENLLANKNIFFISLYISDYETLKERLSNRSTEKYSIKNIIKLYKMNNDLMVKTRALSEKYPNRVFVIDNSTTDVDKSISAIISALAP